MEKPQQSQAEPGVSHLVQCALCLHFDYYPNSLGHNSQHALGKCRSKPWDGNKGQWPMFLHPCRRFEEKEPK